MATRWLRELFCLSSGGDEAYNKWKAVAIFLYRCCGFTNPTEYVQGAGHWFSHDDTGSAGSFSGSVKPTGSITTIVSANHVNGEQMTLDDGWYPPTIFTFSSSPSADTDIDITGSVSADVMRDRIIAAINGIATLEFEATDGGSAAVDLEHYRYGTRGNTTCSETVSDGGFVLTNMTGGLDGWVMTDSVYGAFTAADVGKTVCVVDPTNAVNSGVYAVRTYISANEIELDFRADKDNGEAFTPTSGLTWYMWADDFEIPATNGDYCRLDSPHAASGWAFQITRKAWATDQMRTEFYVATDGNWSGSRILGFAGIFIYDNQAIDDFNINAEVDLDGNYMNIWVTKIRRTAGLNLFADAVMVAQVVQTAEPDRSVYERIVLIGPVTPGDTTNMPRFSGIAQPNQTMVGRVIDESSGSAIQRYCWLIDPSYAASNYGWSGDLDKELNSRLAGATASGLLPWDLGKNEVFNGSILICDPENSYGTYEFIGWVNGHQFSRTLEDYFAKGDANYLMPHILCSQDGGDRNRLYVMYGFIFTWPGGLTLINGRF